MAYKWKPSASQKAAFKERMKDDDECRAYKERKRSKGSYAGFKDGNFVPTKMQYEFAITILNNGLENISEIVNNACNQVMYGYSGNEKIHHSHIHIINSIQRSEKTIIDIDFN